VRRWVTFNAVGLIGVGVQLAVIGALVRWTPVPYLIATTAGVEAAILHNFLWHERWTWRDRPSPAPFVRLERLRRFHVVNGVISLAGNLAIMTLLYGLCGVPVILSNLAAIAACSLLNFALSDTAVFVPATVVRREQA
jgi:putative flippase GtrA